jgi:hypothetical protein
MEEARWAVGLGKPLLLLAEPGVVPPAGLLQAAFRGGAVTLAAGLQGRGALAEVLEDFEVTMQHVAHDDTGAFIFLAASLVGDPSAADDVASVIERASNMSCVRGERLFSANVQYAIIDLIRRAAVVIADVSDDHRNILIEAGIAMGTGTRLKLICRRPSSGNLPKKAFMFEGLELNWYETAEERLGLCYYLARQFRRHVYLIP